MKRSKFKKMTLLITVIVIILVSLGFYYLDDSCVAQCRRIPSADNVPKLSQSTKDAGWYYGQLDQKRPGTPSNWIHNAEETKSAMWIRDYDEKLYDSCDCHLY